MRSFMHPICASRQAHAKKQLAWLWATSYLSIALLVLCFPASLSHAATTSGVDSLSGNDLLVAAGGNSASIDVSSVAGGPVTFNVPTIFPGNTTINASGRVGIGTINPAYTLQVNGPIVSGTWSANGTIGLIPTGAGSWFWLDNPGSNYLRISNGASPGSAPVVITNAGYVGIASTSPRAALDVWGGTIVATGTDYNGTAEMTSSGGTAYFSNNTLTNGIAISAAGNVSIGGSGTMTASAYYHSSDARLKTNIHPVDHALDKILALKGVEFNWKNDGRPDMGVVAQNVDDVFPNIVAKNKDGIMAVEYDSLTGPMIEAIRELKSENDMLRSRLGHMEKELQKIKAGTNHISSQTSLND